MVAQDAYTRRQYARKHFSKPYGLAYLSAVGVGHLVRAMSPRRRDADKRKAARLALRTLAGSTAPPFGAPPQTALPTLRTATNYHEWSESS